MRRDPTEFRQRFAAWKDGENYWDTRGEDMLHGYSGGKTGFYSIHRDKWKLFLISKGVGAELADRLSTYFAALDSLESGNGTSSAARQKNNFGGMLRGGKNISYDTVQDYMNDKWNMMNKRFSRALNAKTVQEYATLINDPKYAGKGYLYAVADGYNQKNPLDRVWVAKQTLHMNNYTKAMMGIAGQKGFVARPVPKAPVVSKTEPIEKANPIPSAVELLEQNELPLILPESTITTQTPTQAAQQAQLSEYIQKPLVSEKVPVLGGDYWENYFNNNSLDQFQSLMQQLMTSHKHGKNILPRHKDGKTPGEYDEELVELPEVRVDRTTGDVIQDGRRGSIRLPNVTIKPDHNVREAVDRYYDKLSRRSERFWYTNPITGESYMPKGGPLESVYPEFDLITLGQMGKPLVKAAGNYIWYSPDAVAQYIRYPIGKMKYGFDAKFPTLYRKFKGGVVLPTEGVVQLTNPDSRFAFYGKAAKGGYGGQQSPNITNMSYGNSVRSHGLGDWDNGYTLAFPGEELIGKRVISTEPSDLFTYGSKISPKTKDVTLISGDPSELKLAEQYGMLTATSPELRGAYDTAINGTRNSKFTTHDGRKFSLVKEDYSEYAKEMRKLERLLFGDIRQKDVDFMNFVLRPEVEGKLYDKSVLSAFKEMPDDVGEWVGSSSRRKYLYDEDEFGKLIYDPISPVESRWRDRIGINLKSRLPQWLRELYHSDPYGYKHGKNPIHINPANRGKFNALKKRTGKTTELLTHSKNPLTRKRAIFALNSRKFKH